jgi:D-alanine-D-alanine ligase
MRIGLTYDLKDSIPRNQHQPEDALEEYDSIEMVNGIAVALEAKGHSTLKLGGGKTFLTGILQEKIDLAFNISEGLGNFRSREAQVPGVLEMLDVPFTGSDPQCLAVCLDKPLTKKLVELDGVVTPKWQIVNNVHDLETIDWKGFPFPAFLKPAFEGSSKGIRFGSRVENVERVEVAVAEMLERYCQPVMAEEYIEGDELTVGIIGNPAKIVGVMRVIPRKNIPHFVYSLEVKRDWENLVEYEVPAKLGPEVFKKLTDSALKAFEILGCRDFGRVDFRIRDGIPYFLEINPLPGLNPKSGDFVILSRMMGWSYENLIAAIVDAALARYPECVRK